MNEANIPMIITCWACEGEGRISDNVTLKDCDICGGSGYIYEQEFTDTERFI